MKKILLMALCLFLLTSCNKNTNQTQTNNEINENNIASSEENQENQDPITFEGQTDNYNITMRISKFTKENLDDIAVKYGEDSDSYLSMQDDMPSYKMETYVVYVGDEVEDIDSVESMKFVTEIDGEEIESEVHGRQEIMKALYGQVNVTADKYFYPDQKRGKLPSEDSKIIVKSTENTIDALNFECVLTSN